MTETKNKIETKTIDGLTIEELVFLEKIARIVCTKYENITKRYDGTINTSQPKYDSFKKYNDIHNLIIEKMELLLNKLF